MEAVPPFPWRAPHRPLDSAPEQVGTSWAGRSRPRPAAASPVSRARAAHLGPGDTFPWDPGKSTTAGEVRNTMSIKAERKKELIQEYAIQKGDTGSPEVQVAILSEEIKNLTEHLKAHRKDYTSRRGLLMKVGRRSKLLNYLRKGHVQRYQAVIQRLGLRR